MRPHPGPGWPSRLRGSVWRNHPRIPRPYCVTLYGGIWHHGSRAGSTSRADAKPRLAPPRGAQYLEPISVADVLASRPIPAPLKLLDCCPVSDGGQPASSATNPARPRAFASAGAARRTSSSTSAPHRICLILGRGPPCSAPRRARAWDPAAGAQAREGWLSATGSCR